MTGQPKLKLTGVDGRLSGPAEAGTTTPISLTVSNDGTMPTDEIELAATPPSQWKVEFDPKKLDKLVPGETREVHALLTPSASTTISPRARTSAIRRA